MTHSVIVTVCDRKFLEGAFILVASLRYNRVKTPIVVVAQGFGKEDTLLLEQFGDITVISGNEKCPPQFLKIEALLKVANYDWITYLDADCMIIGDITEYLMPKDDLFHIRFRSPPENRLRFRRYQSADDCATIPGSVLAQWKNDLKSSIPDPQIKTTCVTNAFTFPNKDISIIQAWREQSDYLLRTYGNTMERVRFAYSHSSGVGASDELVLNSILAYSPHHLKFGEYLLDKDRNARLVHFALHPKPWIAWQRKYFKYFDYVCELYDWVEAVKLVLPPRPWWLKKKHRTRAALSALINGPRYQWKRLWQRLKNA